MRRTRNGRQGRQEKNIRLRRPEKGKGIAMKFSWKEDGKALILIGVASFIMALNIKTFVRTGDLFPGGATGLTVLVQRFFAEYMNVQIPYTIINLPLNAFPVYVGFRFIGKKFTIFSLVMIMLTSFLTDLIPSYPITYDVLLISVFGGIINGTAISLCLRAGATSGGTDFIAIYLSEKKQMDGWNIVLGINAIILCAAGLLFGWDRALYSIIFQYVSTQILHILYQKSQQETLFIITNKPEEVAARISEVSHHGATIMEGEGSYEHVRRYVVYSVVARAESRRVINTVKEADPAAFINSIRTDHLHGRFYSKPRE